MGEKIIRHQDLDIYKKAFEAAMQIFELSKKFPKAEAWRKRRYEAAFISKLNDAEGEAAETQTWIEFAVRCEYLTSDSGRVMFQIYDQIIATFVGMISHSSSWVMPSGQKGINR